MGALEKEVKQECQMYQFPEQPKEKVVEVLPKFTKSGEIKKTPNNTKENRDNVQPFKEDDIPKISKYYKSKIDNARSLKTEMSYRRDLTLFVMGINIGLRISDIITLKWSDIYEDNWTFRDGKVIKPKKTRNKNKHVLLKFNPDFKRAIDYYREYLDDITDMDSYIFTGDTDGHIGSSWIGISLKAAAEAVGIKYNVNTHSLRKSFCRLRYDYAEDKSQVLVELMVLLNHSSVGITKRYICIAEEELEELYNSVSIGFDAIFD